MTAPSALDLLALHSESAAAVAGAPSGALPDLFRGRCVAGLHLERPEGVLERIFGGHVLAQALRASSIVTADRFAPNSLHAYFVAPGRPELDVEYTTTVVKRGRSLDLVEVHARQGERVILQLTASFHAEEPGEGYQEPMPDAPTPESLERSLYLPPRTNPEVRAPFDIRPVGARHRDSDPPAPEPHALTWLRTASPVDSDAPVDHAALLTYAIDFLITRASHIPLRRDGRRLDGASLDHAMWFHRPFRADEWMLVSCTGVRFAGARALTSCRVYTRSGDLVASGEQEALLRAPS